MRKKIIPITLVLALSFVFLSMTVIKSARENPWKVPTEYQNMKNPYADMEDEENIGRIVYSKNCKLCHGKKGKGDGTGARSLETPVADFTSETFKNQTDGSLYYKIYTGRGDMPGFEKIIPEDEDLWLLINYIKSM